VKITGMNPEEELPPEVAPRGYYKQPVWKRIVVIAAGPAMNVLVAFAILFALGLTSEKLTHRVGSTTAGSPAAAKLRPGDRIVAVEGQPISEWEDLPATIEDRAGDPTTFTVERDGTVQDLEITPRERSKSDSSGFIGVSPRSVYEQFGVLGSFRETFVVMWDTTKATGEGLGRLFSPAGIERYSRNFTGEESTSGSSASEDRPVSIIGIVDIGGEIVGGNVWALLGLLGAINLLVALFNLIPLLPFDGGHAAVAVYEQIASKIRGREVRVDFRKLIPVTALVLVVFLTLGLSAMFLDIRRIFTGS
jgi:membrane-associated protease RseP (regulator of RpoE activity)